MEVVILQGGLGNQMFQYAFYLAKRQQNASVVVCDYWIRRNNDHNGYELDSLFGIRGHQGLLVQNTVRVIRKLLIFKRKRGFQNITSFLLSLLHWCGIQIIFEKGIGIFDSGMLNKHSGFCFYCGFWETEKYFLSIKHEILNAFRFDDTTLSVQTRDVLRWIENTNSVSIHFRRGDFLTEENQILYGNICTPDYYNRAIKTMGTYMKVPVYFVFSDDIEWVRENMSIPNPNYIDWNQGQDSWQDMFLMSRCKHNIIANSTFSWWGAWLNRNEGKTVIAPFRFCNSAETPDFIPASWMTVGEFDF
ncbi:alpha-1,2-fucosyltransferase [Bacteroidia bacterium]|nr:alpha-1,2-fucosyltransferase [Bacteroidia bacterium]